jgi:hypothetical protein
VLVTSFSKNRINLKELLIFWKSVGTSIEILKPAALFLTRGGYRGTYKTAFVISSGLLRSSTFLQSSNDLGLKNLSRSIPNPN